MLPLKVSASPQNTYKPSFHGIASVRYVHVDGMVNEDAKVIEGVTKALAETMKTYTPENHEVRKVIKEVVPDFYPNYFEQPICPLKPDRFKGFKMWRLITGEDSAALKRIWAQSGVSQKEKVVQAGNRMREIVHKGGPNIAITAVTEKIKGKIKYIIKNVHKTI